VYDLFNGSVFSDLKWPLTWISRSRGYHRCPRHIVCAADARSVCGSQVLVGIIISSEGIQKSATCITLSTVWPLLNWCCSEAAVVEMTHTVFDVLYLKRKLTDFDNFWYNSRCGFQLLKVYKIFNLTRLYSCVPTLPYKLPHNSVQHVFFGRLWVALERTGCLQPMFKMMPLRRHACTQSCSPLINGLVDDALRNAPPVTL